MPNHLAIRTPRYEYIDYAEGKDELYDLYRDPRQTQSIFANPPGGVLVQMRSRLEQLRGRGVQVSRRPVEHDLSPKAKNGGGGKAGPAAKARRPAGQMMTIWPTEK